MSVSLVPSHARWSFPAGSASLSQFQFVALNSTGQIVAPSATGVFAYVLDDAPSIIGATISNDIPTLNYSVGTNYGCVAPAGVFQKVIFGATLSTPGTAIMTNTSGQAVAAVTGAVVLGWTLAAQSSADIGTVLLNVAAHY